MNHAFGNALTIEVSHFLEEQEIFKDYWAARADSQGILVVADRAAGVGGHRVFLFFGHSSSSDCSRQRTKAEARDAVRRAL